MGILREIGKEKREKSQGLKTLEVYCLNETCGDPVSGFGGKVAYTKRRMQFNRMTIWSDAEFRCPVCGAKRVFRYSVFLGGSEEVK